MTARPTTRNRGEDGSSRGCRPGRSDLLQELVRVGHPEMLDNLAARDPVDMDGRQRDALPRGRHLVERPGVGAWNRPTVTTLAPFPAVVSFKNPPVGNPLHQLVRPPREPGP